MTAQSIPPERPGRAIAIVRTILAFLIAPVSVPTAMLLLVLMLHGMDAEISLIFVFFAFLAVPGAWVLGVPAHVLLLKRGSIRLRYYVGMGACIGVLTLGVAWFSLSFRWMLMDDLPLDVGNILGTTLGFGPLAAVIGAIVGAVFWLIVFWRNRYYFPKDAPDRNSIVT